MFGRKIAAYSMPLVALVFILVFGQRWKHFYSVVSVTIAAALTLSLAILHTRK